MIGVSAPGAVTRGRGAHDGARRDRLRDGEPGARGAAGGGPRRRRDHGDRPLGLPEPDQQRARVPGRLQGRARGPREDDQRGDEARRRGRDRARDPRRGAARRLHHPERVQPPGRRVGGRGRRQRRGRERRRAAQARRDRASRRRRWRPCDDRPPALHGLRRGERAAGQRPDGAADRLRARPAGDRAEGVLRPARAARAPRHARRGDDSPAPTSSPIFRERPAIHRFPGAMAQRVHDLAVHIVETYDGDAGRVWGEDVTPEELQRRLYALPGLRRDEGRTRWPRCWPGASASRRRCRWCLRTRRSATSTRPRRSPSTRRASARTRPRCAPPRPSRTRKCRRGSRPPRRPRSHRGGSRWCGRRRCPPNPRRRPTAKRRRPGRRRAGSSTWGRRS